jgi:predicted small secreted protein
MKHLIWKLMICLIIGVSSAVLTGCHTAEGLGKDIEDAGEELQKAVD